MEIAQKVKIIDGDFLKSKDLDEYLIENDGSIYLDQWISIDVEGIQYDLDYTLDASAKIVIDNGSRWTPPCVEVLINRFNIEVNSISSNEEILEVTEDEKSAFQTILKNII